MSWNIQAKVFTVLFTAFLSGHISYLGYCAPSGNLGDDAFTIQHVNTSQCLVVSAEAQSLSLANCTTSVGPGKLWKWGSNHRLFHVGSSRCLGLEVHTKTLALSNCDSTGTMLKWLCVGQAIYTDYEMGLTTAAGAAVVAKRKPADAWRKGGSEENICQQPYKTIHTKDGNALGSPCVFPFNYNGTWHHGCLPGQPDLENLAEELSWCSSTMNFEQQGKWGFCLQNVEGCHTLWESSTNGHCYQTVATAAVTWHEARDSCRSQGGDLLSVSSVAELKALESMNLPDRLWIGLNQMDWAEGWQWSDGSPLYVVNWASDMPTPLGLGELDCGVLTSGKNYENAMCERKLPYICKKSDSTKPTERTVYKSTECEDGWFPWDGRCIRHFMETLSQSLAQQSCASNNASLLSIHSLEDMLMFNDKLPSVAVDMWTGLTGGDIPLVFEWQDGSNVTYTHWAKGSPHIKPDTRLPTCVRFTGENHEWVVTGCDENMSYLCAKEGVVNTSVHDEGCTEGWRRHGNACYRVDIKPVSFKHSCNLTINDRFEKVFINRLLREQLGSKTQYFWTGLQDIKGNGEFSWTNGENVTLTNWGYGEPGSAGGCAVMSTSRPLGKWFTRNCSLFEAGTICKKYLTPPPPPPKQNLTAPCPNGWFSKEGIPYCYKVFHEERLTRKRTWAEAEGFCHSLGAHLPSFGNVDEMTALHYVMRDVISDDRYFWVGMNRRNPNNDNSWEWSDGRPMSTSIFPMEVHEDDEYNRDCTAFKSLRGSFHLLFFFLLHDLPPRPFYATPFHCDAQLEWACQIPRGTTPLQPIWYNPGGHHDTSVFVDGQEFWFVTNPQLSYEEATMYCSSNNSRLAVPVNINSARTMQEEIQKHSQTKYIHWWADLRDPGPYVPLPFTQLHFYHSSFLGRCPSLSQESMIPEYKEFCSAKLPFVCEVLNVTAAEKQPIGPHPKGLPCDGGSIAFRDKCYTLIPPVDITFQKATEICQAHRAQLITIRDQVEQDFINTLLPSIPALRTWIGLKLNSQAMLWEDDTPVTYLNFHPLVHGQYRRIHVNGPEAPKLCAYIFRDPDSDTLGTWDYTSCTDFQNVSICQHYADKPEVAVVSDQPFQVQTSLSNHTYQLVHGENMTWFHALEQCKNQDMELASVADAFQQAVLTVNVSRLGKPLWIGLFSEDDGEHYRWTDHSHTVFSRWSEEVTAGRCVYLDTDGFWKATECGQGLTGAICHIPHEDIITPEHASMKCPHKGNGPNWFPYKNNCYTFQMLHSRWDHHDNGQIQKTCQELDPKAALLTIRDEEENEFLRKKLMPLKSLAQFVWLGLHKDNDTKQLKWYDDTYVQYSNWKGGRPEVEGEFLAGLSLDGRWDLFSDKQYFQIFKQRTVVACKIEQTDREEFQKSPWDVTTYANHSYRVEGRKLTWFQAQEECAQGGGHLASILSADQSKELLAMAKRDGFPLWIGLSNQAGNGSAYEWSDGSKFDYSPAGFHKGSVVDGCVFMDTSGIWISISCQDKMEGALCYNSTVEQAKPQKAPESHRCPKTDGASQWVEHGEHCYAFDMTFYNYTVYNLTYAKRVCEQLDSSAHLLSIKSEVENDFVSKYISSNPHITNRVWLGLGVTRDTTGFKWMDDSKVDFSKWSSAPLSTRIFPPPDICAVMVTNEDGIWKQTSCLESRSRIVCKIPMRSGGMSPAAIFCIIVIPALLGIALYILYKKNRHHFFSAVRYQRSFDDVDSTSIINDTE